MGLKNAAMVAKEAREQSTATAAGWMQIQLMVGRAHMVTLYTPQPSVGKELKGKGCMPIDPTKPNCSGGHINRFDLMDFLAKCSTQRAR